MVRTKETAIKSTAALKLQFMQMTNQKFARKSAPLDQSFLGVKKNRKFKPGTVALR